MSFSASQKSVNELLSRNCSYLIPKNQRKYVWGETEWSELFEDVFLIEQSSNYAHFIGSFVFSETKKTSEYSIVDGQQRLITISALICCLADALNSINEAKVSNSFVHSFLIGTNNGEDFPKISRDDGAFFLIDLINEIEKGNEQTPDKVQALFKTNFDTKDRYNKRILECYLHFKKKIDDFIKSRTNKKEILISMKDKIVFCQGIEIIVSSDVEGFRVFETLNARGIPLEQHELIKNYFYSYLRTKEKVKSLDSKWDKIIANVTTEKADYFSAFITHYCVHRFGKIKRNEEFKTIRDRIEKRKADELLNSIYHCSTYYAYIVNPEKYRSQTDSSYCVYVSLNFFHVLNIRQVRPLILSLFEAFEDRGVITKNDFEKAMVLLETFYFMYVTLLKGTTNQIDNSIITLSKRISDANEQIVSSDLIKSELSKFVSERDKIKQEFVTIGYSNKNPKFDNSSNRK